MSYDWTMHAEVLGMSEWYHTGEFKTFVQKIKGLNFSYVKDRQTFYAEYGQLRDAAPFEETTRFPQHGFFLTSFDVRLRSAMDMLRSAAAYRDLQKDQSDKQKNGGDSKKDEVNGASYNDAANQFRQGVKEMEALLLSTLYLWNRRRFESHVTWRAAPAANPGGAGPSGGGKKP